MKLNKKGVSLPELLAVIVIMGLIAAISIPAFSSMIKNSKKDKIITEVKGLYDKIEITLKANDVTDQSMLTMELIKDIQSDFKGNIPFFEDDENGLQNFKDAIVVNEYKGTVNYVLQMEYSTELSLFAFAKQGEGPTDLGCVTKGHIYKDVYEELTRACIK